MYQSQSQYDEEPVGEPHYGDAAVHGSSPTPKRRRRIVTVASLVTLLVCAVTVDRVVAARAESRTGEAFQEGMATPHRPSVHVSGFPVLTQLASGTLRHVDITADDIPARGTTRPLPVTKLTVGLDGLKTSGSADEAHARSVEATAFLSYEDVAGALGLDISQGDEPGRVDATVSLPLAGQVTVSTAVAAASGNRIAFTDVRVTQGEPIPPAKALLDKAMEEPVPLENIPEGLHLRSVTTSKNGINVVFTGKSVRFHPRPTSG